MTIFKGGYGSDITTGLMNLQSVAGMIYCIAQDDSSTQELDAFTLLGISNILDNTGHEIEAAYGELLDKHEAMVKRYRKMLVELSVFLESHGLSCDSDLAKILADAEQEVNI